MNYIGRTWRELKEAVSDRSSWHEGVESMLLQLGIKKQKTMKKKSRNEVY